MRYFKDTFLLQEDTICYPNNELFIFGEILVYKYNIIVTLISINIILLLFVCGHSIKLIYKKPIFYSQDDYQTTVTINNMT